MLICTQKLWLHQPYSNYRRSKLFILMHTDTPNDLPEYFTNICRGLVFSWQIMDTHAIPDQRPLGPIDENQKKCQKIKLYLTWVHIPNWTGLLIGCAFLYEAFVVTGNMRSSFNANSLMEARSGKCMLLPFSNIMSWMWSQYYPWAAGKLRFSNTSPCPQIVSTKIINPLVLEWPRDNYRDRAHGTWILWVSK